MSSGKSSSAASYAVKAFEDKVAAQIHEAKARLEHVEAKAKGAEADVAKIDGLKAAKQSIDQRVKDLKATTAGNLSRAKAEIDADVASFKAGVQDLAAKFTTPSKRK